MKLHKLRGPDAQRKGEVFGTTANFKARQIAQVFACQPAKVGRNLTNSFTNFHQKIFGRFLT